MGDSASDPPPRRPRIARLYRMQWEEAQQAHVLLFPEGMIKLNGSAGEILRRCDGARTVGEIVAELESAFAATGLGADVEAFLETAGNKGWIEWIPA
jgi:pyrroloquinoline quinone biosynthesis protein D